IALLPRFLVDAPVTYADAGADMSASADPSLSATAALVELTSAPRCDVEREIWLVVHPDVRRSPRVQRVADAIADAVRAA
ncbi:LysR family transcriptional regulator, partial [Paraburkholderia sp. SIMBA_049]